MVTDPVLLAILSHPHDLESVRPHLRLLFNGIHDVILDKQQLDEDVSALGQGECWLMQFSSGSMRFAVVSIGAPTPVGNSSMDVQRKAVKVVTPSVTPSKIDKRLTEVHVSHICRSFFSTPLFTAARQRAHAAVRLCNAAWRNSSG